MPSQAKPKWCTPHCLYELLLHLMVPLPFRCLAVHCRASGAQGNSGASGGTGGRGTPLGIGNAAPAAPAMLCRNDSRCSRGRGLWGQHAAWEGPLPLGHGRQALPLVVGVGAPPAHDAMLLHWCRSRYSCGAVQALALPALTARFARRPRSSFDSDWDVMGAEADGFGLSAAGLAYMSSVATSGEHAPTSTNTIALGSGAGAGHGGHRRAHSGLGHRGGHGGGGLGDTGSSLAGGGAGESGSGVNISGRRRLSERQSECVRSAGLEWACGVALWAYKLRVSWQGGAQRSELVCSLREAAQRMTASP